MFEICSKLAKRHRTSFIASTDQISGIFSRFVADFEQVNAGW